MEKVSLYVKKILALILSSSVFYLAGLSGITPTKTHLILIAAVAFLLFAYLDFRISGEKPRFLFGMNQSDTHLNKKGGFWNLFKWILNLFGFLYDLAVWSVWGAYLVFVLLADFLLLIKTIFYWIIHAVIWFIRQLFPPFVFIFRMAMHYLVNWSWWIYKVTVKNVRITVNRNFYFIALWGTIPALFIIFLFFAMGQLVGIPQLVVLSSVFALIPLVWSYGEISAWRFEQREKDNYTSVRSSFRNGFDAVRSVLFYLIIVLIMIVLELILNLVGWIPNLSMSLLGISLNLNMAISVVLIILAVIISFAGSILPTHILYRPEHENDLTSSLAFLLVICKRCLRYFFSGFPAALFGSLLLVIPLIFLFLAFNLTDSVKNGIMDKRIEQLENRTFEEPLDAYAAELTLERLDIYKNIPLQASDYFADLRNSANQVKEAESEINYSEKQIGIRKASFDSEIARLNNLIAKAKAVIGTDSVTEEIALYNAESLDLEESYQNWESVQKENISKRELDIREIKSKRSQMPILYLFAGILFAVFGGLVIAVFVAYIGNVYFELYDLREDDKPAYWCQTLTEFREKDPNQPLLGFTLLAIIITPLILFLAGVIGN